MPAITATNMQGGGVKNVTETTLDGSDTLTYNSGRNAVLYLRNPTAGALSPVIDGDGASAAHPVQGVGSIDLTSGYAVGSIAAGAAKAIQLDSIKEYLKGTIAINTGTGLVASLLEF